MYHQNESSFLIKSLTGALTPSPFFDLDPFILLKNVQGHCTPLSGRNLISVSTGNMIQTIILTQKGYLTFYLKTDNFNGTDNRTWFIAHPLPTVQ